MLPKKARLASIVSGMPMPAEAKAPSRILVVPWGHVESTQGDFEIGTSHADSILEWFQMRGLDVVVDYEHGSLRQLRPAGGKSLAAGWIKGLQVQPGVGIFGDVEWTDKAAAEIAAKQYRYLSPVVLHEDDGTVFALHSMGLTNRPAISGWPAFVNVDEISAGVGGSTLDQETKMKTIVTALALADGSDEKACVDAIKKLQTDLEAAKKAPALPVKVCQALAMADTITVDEAAAEIGKIKAKAGADPDPAKFVAMSDYTALRDEVKGIKAKQLAEELDAFIKVGQEEGRMKAADEETWRKKFTANADDARSSLALIPPGTFPSKGRTEASKPVAQKPPASDDAIVAHSDRFDEERMDDYGRISAYAKEHKCTFEQAISACSQK